MITVTPYDEAHAPALAALMLEMARFYSAALPEGFDAEAALRKNSAGSTILLGWHGEALASFATAARLFPVGALEALLHVQQVCVGAGFRRLGVARALLGGMARLAPGLGCTSLEWSTDALNTTARALYDGLGATGSDKRHYSLKGEALLGLASGG